MPFIPFRIDHMTINTTDWNPIVAAVNGDAFSINNMVGPDDILLSHSPTGDNATTIYKGNQWSLPSTPRRIFGLRYHAGDTLGYVKSTLNSPRELEVTYVL